MTPKAWWKSKTVWIAILQGVAGFIVAISANDPTLQNIAAFAILKTVVDLTLRAITIEPIE